MFLLFLFYCNMKVKVRPTSCMYLYFLVHFSHFSHYSTYFSEAALFVVLFSLHIFLYMYIFYFVLKRTFSIDCNINKISVAFLFHSLLFVFHEVAVLRVFLWYWYFVML